MIDEKPQIFSKENKKTTDKNGKQKGDLKNPPGDIVDILLWLAALASESSGISSMEKEDKKAEGKVITGITIPVIMP